MKDGILGICSVTVDTKDVHAIGGNKLLPDPGHMVGGASIIILREGVMEVPAVLHKDKCVQYNIRRTSDYIIFLIN